MKKNVLEWLENIAEKYPNQCAYQDPLAAVTFSDVLTASKVLGSALAKEEITSDPVAVFTGRNVRTPMVFYGVVYSGRAYAPIDSSLPELRIKKILMKLNPSVLLTDRENEAMVRTFAQDKRILIVEDLLQQAIDEELLSQIRREMVVTDPLYLIFTSGSTGNPKGVITSHLSLMTYIESYAKVMEINESDRLGNQSPLDYIAAIRDLYLPLRYGCQTYIIPKQYFMNPDQLFSCLNEQKITCVGWCVSAFTIATALGAFEEMELTTLKKICFSGSIMPCSCLRKWQKHLPDTKFVNQYGPTEITASCTYYVLDHYVEENEVLPIGHAYENYQVTIRDSKGELLPDGQQGEICVSGPCLALGYYHDPERTEQFFVCDTSEQGYPKRIYHTGDIGRVRKDGMLEFLGRMDRQIKHMGHRVELDEVEYAANQIAKVAESCCLYQSEKEKLWLFYSGEIEKRTLLLSLKDSLPEFMVPRKVVQLTALPKLSNGKIDMSTLREEMK